MAGKPPSANDYKRNAPPLQRYAWDVYRAAARARWVGRVIASTADEAIEVAAVEYKNGRLEADCRASVRNRSEHTDPPRYYYGMDNRTPGKKPPAPSVSQRPDMTLLLRKMRVQARIEGLRTDIWGEDDYAVVDGETCVGRIYREMIHEGHRWLWCLQTDLARAPNSGMVDTLEEAKTEFKWRYAGLRGRA